MIQITAYLRDEEDLAKWKALKNKSEFLHDALNKVVPETKRIAEPILDVAKLLQPVEIIKTPADAKKAVQPKDDMKFCPNGHPIPEGRTKCMGKGCKYS